MGVLEKISEALHNNEEKTVELRKRFLKLIFEWGCFEKDLKLSTKLQECFNEMELKQLHLGSVQESMVESLKELDGIRESIERKRIQVERKEEVLEAKWKDFRVAKEGFAETVKLKEEKLNDQEKMVERLWEEVEFERGRVGDVEEKFMEVRVKEKELNRIQSWIQQETNALEVKDRELDKKMKEFQVKERSLLAIKKELGVEEMGLESIKKELVKNEIKLGDVKKVLKVNENNLDYVKKELREKEINLESVKKDLAVEESKLDNLKKEVRVKESKLESLKKERREKENNLEIVKKELGVKENRLDSVKKELGLKESDLDILKKELREKEKNLDNVTIELREKEMDLDSVKKAIAVKVTRLDSTSEELKLKGKDRDILMKELEEKEKNLNFVKKELSEKETNLDSVKNSLAVKVTRLGSTSKELRLKEKSLDIVMKELEVKEKNLDFVIKELREKENDLESVKLEFKAEADNLDTRRKQLESKEDFLSSMKKELEHKEKFLDTMKKKLELQEEHLKSSHERLYSTQEAYKQRFEELNSKEKKLDSEEEAMKKSYEDFKSEKGKFLVEQGLFEQRMKDVIHKEDRVKDRLEELESRDKYFEDRSKELEEKEKQLNAIANAHIKTDPTEDVAVERVNAIAGDSVATRFVVIMDGKSLQIFLNEHEKELDFLSVDVFKALQMSSDPAQLVLDAMEGFYPPHLRKGETEFQGSVARQSCILLLEQLIRVSPKISSPVMAGASKLAREWKAKMQVTKGNQDEILGFLYLLASYNLVSAFDEYELIILLEIVAKHDKFAELRRSLCMKEKILCFIQNLLTKQQHLEAIRYAYVFELVDHFSPEAILKDYLECVERSYADVCEKEACSIKEKIEAIEQKVTSIRAVIRCIPDYKLQSQYPVEQLEECITRLKEDQTALSAICEAKKTELVNVKQMESTCPSIFTGTKALSSTSFSARAPTCTLSHSNAMAVILMSMRGKSLQYFLNKHFNEQKLLRSEVFSALRMSPDPGMLVLEALEGFYPTEYLKEETGFDRSIIRQSCILLLEKLMKLSPGIKPEAKLEATKLAFAWKAKMMGEMGNHLAILGFLLLLGSFRLASAFDKYELDSLNHKVAQHGSTSEICHVLGILDDTSKESRRHKAQLSTDESIYKNMDMKCEGHDIICNCASSLHCTSDPALLVLDALRSCDLTNLGRSENLPSVIRSFSDLLDHLREVSPEIEPHVKAEATVFAVDWCSRLIESRLNPAEVLAFLQLLATYKLTGSFNSNVLLGLLEKVHQTEKVVALFKSLGLTDKTLCFIQNLRNKKQWLAAFAYVYEFELVNRVSPVLLLKDYVSHSNQIAKQILHAGKSSHRAQMKAISCETNALRNTVRRIMDRGLQSEYSLSPLQEQIEKLECQMSKLTQSSHNQHFTDQQVKTNKGTSGSAPITQARKELTKKRCAPAGGTDVIHKAQGKQNFKRHCHSSMRR